MYLSRLRLNPRSRQVQREVADIYQMHRTVMRAFPEQVPAEERVLFRLDVHPRSGALVLLVQSHLGPEWSYLDESYLLSVDTLSGDEPNPAVKQVQLDLAHGQVLAFRLRANPTVKRAGKRQGLYREEEQLAWLARKAEQGGFRLLSAQTSQKEKLHSQRHEQEIPHTLTLLGVQFDGLLQVRDPVLLRTTVAQGIGSAKGLGFGLLSLARAV